MSGLFKKYFQRLDISWTFALAKVGHISTLHAPSTVYYTTKNLIKPLLQLGFCAIIGSTQKRNRKINGRVLYNLFELFKMIIPSTGSALRKHYITIKEASTICEISPSTIERGVREGTFPPKLKSNPLKKGSAVRFLIFQIEEWLMGKRGDWNLFGEGV